MPYVNTRGRRLHYETVGDGPPVLFLHGLSNYGLVWAPQLDVVVNRGCRAIVPDLPGHGLSGRLADVTTARDIADDILVLLDHLEVERAIVCGHSLGAMVAQYLLVDSPDLVAGAIVASIGAHLKFPHAADVIGSWCTMWRSPDGPVARLAHTWPDMTTDTYRRSYAGRAYFEAWRHVLANVDGASLALVAEGLLEFDLRDRLDEVDCPVIVVAGEHDRMSPLPMVEELAKLIPEARLEVVEGSGHIVNRERADLFNQLLGELLAP